MTEHTMEGRVLDNGVFRRLQQVFTVFSKFPNGRIIKFQSFRMGHKEVTVVFCNVEGAPYSDVIEVYSYEVLEKIKCGELSRTSPGYEFKFDPGLLAEAMKPVISENEDQGGIVRRRKIWVSVNYRTRQISVCKWKNQFDRSVPIYEPGRVETGLGYREYWNLTPMMRWVDPDHIHSLYGFLKKSESSCEFARITMGKESCEVVVGVRSFGDTMSLRFPVSKNEAEGESEWVFRIKRFTRIYPDMEDLPAPRPLIYFGGKRLMYELRDDRNVITARIIHTVDDSILLDELPSDDDASVGEEVQAHDPRYMGANDGVSSESISSKDLDYPDEESDDNSMGTSDDGDLM